MIFCIYSNTMGNCEQALLVRKTASVVFHYCESFGKGYMILASNEPFTYTSVGDACGGHQFADGFISPTQFIALHHF